MEEKPKSSAVLRVLRTIAFLVVLIVLYVLSIGPAAYVATLAGEGSKAEAACGVIY